MLPVSRLWGRPPSTEKRTGHPAGTIAFVPSKDVETAKQLLAQLPPAELPVFIDYALAEARKTDFDVQTLGGIKQYLAGYIARRNQRATEKVREASRSEEERQDAERHSYETSRRAQALDLSASLPERDRAAIEAQAAACAAKFSEHHGDRLTTFEQWRTERGTIS